MQINFKKITSHWQQAGLLKPKTTQNKWSHSQASACLTQSFCAVFFNISHEPNCSPTWCYYLVRIYTKHLFIISEDICTEHLILLVFALNISWGLPSLLFFCNDTNPYYSYIQLGKFLTLVELWVGVEHPQPRKDSKMPNTDHFNWKTGEKKYTQTHHCHQLRQMNFFTCHIAMLRAWSKAACSRGAEESICIHTRSVLCSLCKQFITDQELVVCDTCWIQLHPPQVHTGFLPN